MQKITHHEKHIKANILDLKTKKVQRLIISSESNMETVQNTIRNYITTSIEYIEEYKLREESLDMRLIKLAKESAGGRSPECPMAPIKKRAKFRDNLIEGKTEPTTGGVPVTTVYQMVLDESLQKFISDTNRTFVSRMAPRCKSTVSNGARCKCTVKKYDRCQYHLNMWKRRNPFMAHP